MSEGKGEGGEEKGCRSERGSVYDWRREERRRRGSKGEAVKGE